MNDQSENGDAETGSEKWPLHAQLTVIGSLACMARGEQNNDVGAGGIRQKNGGKAALP
ncbi:hypothetical protein [Sphingomonas pruni]|uniref:hypothetical protein n=1 Tax=Sphingomonas pruni TaxID=40683 RepID=UPI0012EDF117|nr:hypothetical protein [Sphingomonas pruni]